MQTLGLSDSDPRSESRIKSLFWPSIESGADVDYLGAQGYWVCAIVGTSSFLFSLLQGKPILGVTMLLFFYFGGVGVRERDLFAAVIVFVFYLVDTLVTVIFLVFATPWGMIVLRAVVTALLLSNLRATWMASSWRPISSRLRCHLAWATLGRINSPICGRQCSGQKRGYPITSFRAFFCYW